MSKRRKSADVSYISHKKGKIAEWVIADSWILFREMSTAGGRLQSLRTKIVNASLKIL